MVTPQFTIFQKKTMKFDPLYECPISSSLCTTFLKYSSFFDTFIIFGLPWISTKMNSIFGGLELVTGTVYFRGDEKGEGVSHQVFRKDVQCTSRRILFLKNREKKK